MPPGPLKSPLRALSVDIRSMLANLLADMLSLFEVKKMWCTGTWSHRWNERSCGTEEPVATGRSTNYCLNEGASDYRSAGDYNEELQLWES